jgi:hypothetical protein
MNMSYWLSVGSGSQPLWTLLQPLDEVFMEDLV